MPLDNSLNLRSKRQQGVVSIMTAIVLVLLLTLLALVVDTGRLYMEQRYLQKVADMAALEASARIPGGNCSGRENFARAAALSAAERHGFNISASNTLDIECITITTNASGLREVTDNADGSGVSVAVTKEVPASIFQRVGDLFSYADRPPFKLSASASAQRTVRDEPVAAFTVGTQLLDLSEGKLLSQLLKGIGLNTKINPGLANISITPSGLLQALGVNLSIDQLALLTPNELVNLVNTEVGALGISRLLAASATLVGDETLRSSITALGNEISTNTSLRSARLNLLGTGNRGIIRLRSGPGAASPAALDTRINLGELIAASLLTGLSDTGQAVSLNLGIPLLAGASARITSPPSLAIGPVGTSASNSQISVKLDLLTLIPLVPTIKADISLASGTATLQGINCATTNSPPTAFFDVHNAPVNICLTVLGLGRCDNQNANSPVVRTSSMVEGQEFSVEQPIALGTILRGLLTNLLGLLGYLVGSLLSAILTPIDAVLSLLGLDLGRTDVRLEAIHCGVPTLVQ